MSNDLSEQTRRLVEHLYSAAKIGDVAAFFGCMHDDVMIDEPPFLPYGGVYRGIEGLQRLFPEVTRYLSMTLLEIDHLIVEGNHAVAFVRVPRIGSGSLVYLAEESVVRDGKIAAMRIFFHTDAGMTKLSNESP